MGENEVEIERLRGVVERNRGAVEFAELARLLGLTAENRPEAREICFRGLTASPDNHRGRLELARLFYLDGYISFSLAQLEELRSRVKVPALDRLISAFGSVAKQPVSETVGELKSSGVKEAEVKTDISSGTSEEVSSQEILAELDLDADVLDMYEEVTSKSRKE